MSNFFSGDGASSQGRNLQGGSSDGNYFNKFNKRNVSEDAHSGADTDNDRDALHHTLGRSPLQAMPGDALNAVGKWTNFFPNWPNVLFTNNGSKYSRVGNTVTVHQLGVLLAGSAGQSYFDVPFPIAAPVTHPANIVGEWKGLGPGGWYEGWVTPDSATRMRVVHRVQGTINANYLTAAYPVAWAAGNVWGIKYTYETDAS